MGRKSIADLRRQQILQAFYHCVSEQGLAKASLQTTAKQAGLEKHQLLHYFGNRQALIDAAVEGMVTVYQANIKQQINQLDQQNPLAAFLDWLFLGEFSDSQTDPLLAELLLLSRRDAAAAAQLKQAFEGLQKLITTQLVKLGPNQDLLHCQNAAYLILSLTLGSCELECLGFAKSYRQVVRNQVQELLFN